MKEKEYKYRMLLLNSCNNCHNMRVHEDSYTCNVFMQEHVTFALHCNLLDMKVEADYICDGHKLLDKDLRNKEQEEEEGRKAEIYNRLREIKDKLCE